VRRQAKGLIAAEARMANGLDMAMATDAAMEDAQSVLHEMRGLAVRSADGQLDGAARRELQKKYASLQSDLSDLQDNTSFLGIELLSKDANPVSFPVGAEDTATDRVRLVVGGVDLSAVTASSLTAPDSGSLKALSAIDATQAVLSRRRDEVQDTVDQMATAGLTIQTMRLNLASMTGRSQDAEVAEQMASLAGAHVIALGGLALQSQAQQLPKMAMNLVVS